MELRIAVIQEPEIPTGLHETLMSCLSSGKEDKKFPNISRKAHLHNAVGLFVNVMRCYAFAKVFWVVVG